MINNATTETNINSKEKGHTNRNTFIVNGG